jgi:hypothetical protein
MLGITSIITDFLKEYFQYYAQLNIIDYDKLGNIYDNAVRSNYSQSEFGTIEHMTNWANQL